MNKHLNLFQCYKSAHLEDNVTRAFIIVLKNLPSVYTRHFISEVVLPGLRKNRPDSKTLSYLTNPKLAYDIQVTDSSFIEPDNDDNEPKLKKDNGIILGINYDKQAISLESDPEQGTGSRPDAVIVDPENELSILVEVKLNDSLYQEQLNRHFNKHFNTNTCSLEDVFSETSWSKIADFLAKVQQQEIGDKAKYLVTEFIDYIEELGLTKYAPFRTTDSDEIKTKKLSKFVSLFVDKYREELEISTLTTNCQLFFEDVQPDNVYIYFDNNQFNVGIVIGSGKKWRAEQLKLKMKKDPHKFKSIIEKLSASCKPDYNLSLRIHSLFRLSMFRTAWLADIGNQRYSYPKGIDQFIKLFTDDQYNYMKNIGKDEINKVFNPEIAKLNSDQLDEKGQFPKWLDDKKYLQYCYAHIDAGIPFEDIINLDFDNLSEKLRHLIINIKNTMKELVEL